MGRHIRLTSSLLDRAPRSAVGTVALATLVVSCSVLTPRGPEAQRCGREVVDSKGVLEVAEGIIAADNARDIDQVISYYHPDAILMPPGETRVQGRPNIRPRYVTLFEQFDPAIVPEIEHIDICGDLAVVSGRNGGWLRGRGDRPDRRLSDVYVLVLRRESGRWQIAQLIWHPDGAEVGDF